MSEVQNNKVIPRDASFIMERDVIEYAGAIHNICGDYRSFKHYNGMFPFQITPVVLILLNTLQMHTV